MWEYMTINERIDDIVSGKFKDSLNNAGADGWELVTTHAMGLYIWAFLKRPLA